MFGNNSEKKSADLRALGWFKTFAVKGQWTWHHWCALRWFLRARELFYMQKITPMVNQKSLRDDFEDFYDDQVWFDCLFHHFYAANSSFRITVWMFFSLLCCQIFNLYLLSAFIKQDSGVITLPPLHKSWNPNPSALLPPSNRYILFFFVFFKQASGFLTVEAWKEHSCSFL